MEYPHCGKSVNKVIDSRPFREGIGIQHRRQCLTCAGRVVRILNHGGPL